MSDSGILSGKAILAAVDEGKIKIEPFDPKYMNPASFDLTLGDEVRVYSIAPTSWFQNVITFFRPGVLDSKVDNPTRSFKIGPEGFLLKPGVGYLMHTKERVGTNDFVPALDGKSSIGRLFVKIHETAGLGDCGFFGNYTLEVTCVHPVRLYAGMRIAQIRFHTIVGEVVQYEGRYKGSQAEGAVASRSWEQFD
jgi:dCTP deaminase